MSISGSVNFVSNGWSKFPQSPSQVSNDGESNAQVSMAEMYIHSKNDEPTNCAGKEETDDNDTDHENGGQIHPPSSQLQRVTSIVEKIGREDSFLANGEGVDIYQVVAFQCQCRPPKKTWKLFEKGDNMLCNRLREHIHEFKYDIFYYNIFKALVTFFVQIASVLVLMDYAFDTIRKEADKDFCDQSGAAGPKTMAVSYTTYLSLILWSTVQQGRTAGFYAYCNKDDSEFDEGIYKLVNYTWLTVGRTLCHGVILSAFSLSFMIIFYTTDPMDIILNAVALLFIAEIDNTVVTPNDYEDMKDWLDENQEEWQGWMNKSDHDDDEKKTCRERCANCWLSCRMSTGTFVKICVDVFTFFMVIMAPLTIIVCY